MKFFRRAFGRAAVPGWCSLSPADYDAFRALVAMRLKVSRERVDTGSVNVGEIEIGLQNVALGLAAAPRDRWPAMFDEFVAAVTASPDLDLEPEELRERLRLRICLRDLYGEQHRYVGPLIAEDLQAAYVIDLPTKVRNVRPEDLPQIAGSDAEIFARARDNVAREPLPVPETIEMQRAAMHAYESESFYNASQMLRIEEFRPVERHGALVIAPSVHFLGIVDIANLAVVDALQILPQIAKRGFETMPHPCSPSVYWWRPGKLVRLPFELEGRQIAFTPPDEFVDVLNALREP